MWTLFQSPTPWSQSVWFQFSQSLLVTVSNNSSVNWDDQHDDPTIIVQLIPLSLASFLSLGLPSVPSHSSLFHPYLFLQLSELFFSFEEKPLGAASLAQVHKAVLHDGRTVAIKVQHPKVQRQSSRDIMMMEVSLCLLIYFEVCKEVFGCLRDRLGHTYYVCYSLSTCY